MKVGSFQSPVVYSDPGANVAYALDRMGSTPGLDLAVFPEAFLTGYGAESRDAGFAMAMSDFGALSPLEQFSRDHGTVIVVGAIVAEQDLLRNRAFVISPSGTSYYDKTHLPFLGVDRFVTAGDRLEQFPVQDARLGVLICYDQRPPEPTRTLALEGIDILALPTNWPEGAETSADFISIARAAENKIFVVTCNRVGTESGFRFIGRSRIIDPSGRVLAQAEANETVLVADIDVNHARQKRTVNRPGEYEIDVMGERRPNLYGAIKNEYVPIPSKEG